MKSVSSIDNYRSLPHLVKMSRPITSLIASSLTIFVLYFSKSGHLSECIFRSLPILFLTMIGFILNDIFDIERDRGRGPEEKPLAYNLISRRLAICYASVLLIVAFGLEIYYFFLPGLKIVIITFLLLLFYTPFAHRFPLVKGAYTAVLCCLPLLYGSVLAGRSISLLMYSHLFVFIIGRELILDAKDFEKDLAFGMRTLIYYSGKTRCYIIGWSLMWLSISPGFLTTRTPAGKLLSLVALAALIICTFFSQKHQDCAIKLSRGVMFFGALAIATTAT